MVLTVAPRATTPFAIAGTARYAMLLLRRRTGWDGKLVQTMVRPRELAKANTNVLTK